MLLPGLFSALVTRTVMRRSLASYPTELRSVWTTTMLTFLAECAWPLVFLSCFHGSVFKFCVELSLSGLLLGRGCVDVDLFYLGHSHLLVQCSSPLAPRMRKIEESLHSDFLWRSQDMHYHLRGNVECMCRDGGWVSLHVCGWGTFNAA